MVVPPDYHGHQHLTTHKLRVSGSQPRVRALVRQLRQRRARPHARGGRRPRRVRDLGGRRVSRPDRRQRQPGRHRPGPPLRRAVAADEARRAAARRGRRAARGRRQGSRSRRRSSAAACTTTSSTSGASRPSRRRRRRRGRPPAACARTTRTAWSRSAGCSDCRRATCPATCSATAARTPGSRCSCRTRAGSCGRCPSIPRTTAASGRATSPSRSAATTRDVPPTSGTFDGPYPGELTTHKRAAVVRVEYIKPPRRRRVVSGN